jgi:hypothetical protein
MIHKSKWLYAVMLAVLSFGLLALLSGCPEDVDRLIGVWEGTWIDTGGNDFAVNVEYKADGTFTETLADIPETFSCTFSGTYVHDSAARTVTITVTSTTDPGVVDVGYEETSTYSLSSDYNTMTVTSSTGSGTFTRQ